MLTSGKTTWSADQRFQAVHNPQTNDWSLRVSGNIIEVFQCILKSRNFIIGQILYAQKQDSGVYECQISTTPPGNFILYRFQRF